MKHPVVPANAGTHTPQLIEMTRSIGPRFREDDLGVILALNKESP
jgi:hypothetical protein